MRIIDYSVKCTTPDYYRQLKNQERAIVEHIMEDLGGPNVQTTFRYHPGDETIEIYVYKNGEYHLADENARLNDAEKKVARELQIILQGLSLFFIEKAGLRRLTEQDTKELLNLRGLLKRIRDCE